MPQAIPFAAAYVVSNAAAAAGATVAAQATVAATAATVAASVQTTALVLGASYAVSRLTAPETPKPSNGSLERKDPLAPRFWPYGHCKVSGPVILLEVSGTRLFKLVVFSARELAGIEKFYTDGEERTLTGGNLDNWPMGGSYLYTHLGSPDQLADTELVPPDSGSVHGHTFSGWSSAHRLRSIAYIHASLDSPSVPEDFARNYPFGEPSFSAVGGVKLYDPRRDPSTAYYSGTGAQDRDDPTTWEFSDNQRLVCLDWLTHPDGYAKSWDRIDWASWVPQIAMADQNVALKGGGTEKRYRIATIVYLNEPRGRVLRRILDAGDQQLFTTAAGLIGSRGGVWQAPTVFLDATEILEGQFTHGVPMMDRCNEFTLTAMLPTHEYNEIELQAWGNKTDAEYLAGIVRNQPLNLSQVPSNGQAQRLAKIRMAKINPRWSGSIRTNFAGLNALGEATVFVSFDELNQDGGFNGPFLVNGKIGFSPDKTGVTLSVSAIDPACYTWNAATEEQDAPPVPEDEEALMLDSSMQEAA